MTYQPQNSIVWAQINVRDLDAGAAFYARVTGMAAHRTEMLGADCAIFGGMDGSGFDVQVGEPGTSAGSIVFIAAEGPLAGTLKRVQEAGGDVVGEPMQIPSGQFAVCKDPDGNSVGFYEAF